MIKVLELFAGIGAWKKALTNLKIDNFTIPVEIDKDTINAYNKLHNTIIDNQGFNTIDISKDKFNLNIEIDLIVMSPPCQDFSQAKQTSKKNSERADLIKATIPIIKKTIPRYIIIENVPKFEKSQQNIEFSQQIKQLGYYYKSNILNPIDYNWPQHRPRYFAIYFKDVKDWFNFNWPKEEKLELCVNDVLKDFILTFDSLAFDQNKWKKLPENAKERKNKNGYIWGNYIDNRAYKRSGYIGTIPASFNQPYITNVKNNYIRKLYPLESLLLMGFNFEDYLSFANLSDIKIKKMIGNSIVVKMIELIYQQLNLHKENV